MEKEQLPEILPEAVADNTPIYRAAIQRVIAELQEIKTQKAKLALREMQLSEIYKALSPLVEGWVPRIETYSLADAIRFIFNGAVGRSYNAIEIRAKLEDIGYDLSDYENALASIHTCMRRMLDSGEIAKVETEDKKKRFEAGPELKSVDLPLIPLGQAKEKAE